MAIAIDCRTGPVVNSDGPGDQALRQGRMASLVVADGQSRYYEMCSRGMLFTAANSATQALSVNSTTATGLILSNPAGSGKNLFLVEICVAIASLPAGQSALILTGSTNPIGAATTHTTPLTVRPALIGGSGLNVGLADSAATIAAATIVRVIGAGTAATVAASTSFPPLIRDEIAGAIGIAPGCCVSLQALTTAITVVASMAWEEVPI